MKIEKIEWRNIFSYGNKTECINFGNDGKLWLITGRIGSGKTSFMSLSKLLFYGKTEGFKATNIANRVNKKGWIRGVINTGHDEYVIERMFSPSGLKLEKNGKPIDVAGQKDLQTIIEQEVLNGIPYHLYSNLMSLSLNGFTSFLNMSPSDKRTIVDKIFSLDIINKINEMVKADKRDLGIQINNINSQIFSFNQTMQRSIAELEKLKNSKDAKECEKAVALIDEKLLKVEELLNNQRVAYKESYDKYNSYVKICNEFDAKRNKINAAMGNLAKSIKLYNEDKCPTCGTPFTGNASFDTLKESLNAEYQKFNEELNTVNNEYSTAYAAASEIYKSISEINNGISLIENKKRELSVERARVIASVATGEMSSIQNIINDTSNSINEMNTTLETSSGKMKLLEITEKLYSSDGIKQEMMSAFIPMLNEEIASTLESLQFPYTVSFDNNFNAVIEYFGTPVDSTTMSVGETKEVDLIVVCSIIKMIKKQFPMMNLICLDETVSSVDYETTCGIFRYLKEISSTMGLNIIIVSHASLDENIFDEKIFVEKVSGFTNFHYICKESQAE